MGIRQKLSRGWVGDRCMTDRDIRELDKRISRKLREIALREKRERITVK
jgi:hypothetical protein